MLSFVFLGLLGFGLRAVGVKVPDWIGIPVTIATIVLVHRIMDQQGED